MTKPDAWDRRVGVVEFCVVTVDPTEDVNDSLELLFRAHYGRLVRALTLVAGDRELAADAVQEAFVKAHLRWWRLKHYEDPVGWVRRVAINRLRDGHRRHTREQRAIARLAARPSSDLDDGAVEDRSVAGDARMAELLAELPKQQRMAVTLFYVAELTVAEVAAAMSINEGTVKFHLHRGRERLRLAMPGDDREARRGA